MAATDHGTAAGTARHARAAGKARPDAVARAGLLVWAPVLLGTGIGLWFALPVEPGPIFYAAVAGAALLSIALARGAGARGAGDALRVGGMGLAILLAGPLVAGARAHLVAAPMLDFRYYGPIEGRVVAIDRSARDRIRLTLDRVNLRDMAPARTPERVRISLTQAQDAPVPGRRVMLTGHLGPPPGPAEPGAFDFRRAAFFNRLGAVGYTRTPVLAAGPPPQGVPVAEAVRLHLAQAMREAIGGQEGAVAAALMTGDRSGILDATNQVMRDSNLYHIVSISGLHMSMLAAFVYAGLRLMLAGVSAAGPLAAALAGRPVHKLAAVGAMAAAAAYLWLSGAEVPTARAFLMVAVMLAAILADRRAVSLRTVALAALVILVLSPEALVTPGFQMSFAATAALILFFPMWSRHAAVLPWPVRGAAMLILSSLIAGMATAPLAAAHFNRSTQYGLVANLLAVPVMGAVVMPAGVIAALLAPVGLAGPALWAMGLGTRWMLVVAQMVAGWEGAVFALPAPHGAALPLIGGGATVAALVLGGGCGGRWRIATGAAALAAVLAGALVWAGTRRPDILIADEGVVVGILSDGGRALSKPAGAFVADGWLRADGDEADAGTAAARPGWDGPRGSRRASVGGLSVIHLTGKGAAGRVAQACALDALVVLAARAEGRPAGCRLVDQQDLRRRGAMAGWVRNGALVWQDAATASGVRLWNTPAKRQRWPRGTGGNAPLGREGTRETR